jgi:hypothetical protein
MRIRGINNLIYSTLVMDLTLPWTVDIRVRQDRIPLPEAG